MEVVAEILQFLHDVYEYLGLNVLIGVLVISAIVIICIFLFGEIERRKFNKLKLLTSQEYEAKKKEREEMHEAEKTPEP